MRDLWQRGRHSASSCKAFGTTRVKCKRSKCCVVTATSDAVQPPPAAAAATAPLAAVGQYPNLDSFKALIGEKRFTCTQCGKCCTGAGEVWVSDAEVANIARYLNMPLKRFLALHTLAYSKVEGFKLLKSNMESETRDCTFLRPDNTCVIHPVRPLQCSTYPWWPELMDAKEWQWEKENVCEGFDHPDALPTDLDTAAQQLKQATILEYQKRLAYKPSRKQIKKAGRAASGDSSSSSSGGGRLLNTPPEKQQEAAASWQQQLHRLQEMLDDADDG